MPNAYSATASGIAMDVPASSGAPGLRHSTVALPFLAKCDIFHMGSHRNL
jgi:hypothetical protein